MTIQPNLVAHQCGEFEVPIAVAASSSWEFQIQGGYECGGS
jgi:hypothetical protein